jgi:hypothetical protein
MRVYVETTGDEYGNYPVRAWFDWTPAMKKRIEQVEALCKANDLEDASVKWPVSWSQHSTEAADACEMDGVEMRIWQSGNFDFRAHDRRNGEQCETWVLRPQDIEKGTLKPAYLDSDVNREEPFIVIADDEDDFIESLNRHVSEHGGP